LEEALKESNTEVRIFGKPSTRPYRRMAVALVYDAVEADMHAIRAKAKEVADKITIV